MFVSGSVSPNFTPARKSGNDEVWGAEVENDFFIKPSQLKSVDETDKNDENLVLDDCGLILSEEKKHKLL